MKQKQVNKIRTVIYLSAENKAWATSQMDSASAAIDRAVTTARLSSKATGLQNEYYNDIMRAIQGGGVE